MGPGLPRRCTHSTALVSVKLEISRPQGCVTRPSASRHTQHGLAGGNVEAEGMTTSGPDLPRRVTTHAPSERLPRHGCPAPAAAAHQQCSSTVSWPSGSNCSGANGTLRVPAATATVYQEDGFQVSSRQACEAAARQGPSESLAKLPPKATPTYPHKAWVTGDRQSTRPTTYRTVSPSHGQLPGGPGQARLRTAILLQRTCNYSAIIRGMTWRARYTQSKNSSALSAAASAPLHDKKL